MHPLATALSRLEPRAPRMEANFHTLLNVAMALIFILPLGSLAGLLKRLLPDQPRPADPGTYLDETVGGTPRQSRWHAPSALGAPAASIWPGACAPQSLLPRRALPPAV